MKIGDEIYLTKINPTLFELEATYISPDYPNISEVLNQIISTKTKLKITRQDGDTFYYDYIFLDKFGESRLYVFSLDDEVEWVFA